MELEAEIQNVQSTFDQFVKAVMDANFKSYLQLHSPDVAAEVNEELFVRNSERARDHDFSFNLEGIQFDGRFATVQFSVTAKEGAEEHNDSAEVTLIREEERWSLYET